MVFGNNMSASGLSKYLGEQKSDIMGLVPGMSAMFGGSADVKESVSAAVGAASAKDENSGGGMGFLKYLLPLLLLGALGYWWMNKDKTATPEMDTSKTEVPAKKSVNTSTQPATTTNSTDATTTVDNTSPKSYTLNSNGDIVNGNGAIVFANGSYEFDANGNLVDVTNKRIILPATSISEDFAQKINGLLSGMKKTVTSEDMKTLFGDMIMKKSNRTSYALSNIEFNKENHKISNFSKAEVMGLAGALKENVNGKIEVQVFTADGKNDKESNELSDTRANVIRDMLVTLGVDKKQISAKGMGASDATKAQSGKVDIVIK